MGSKKTPLYTSINKLYIVASFIILLLPINLLATPPQIDPDGMWDSLTYCISSAFVETLEVIDIDGDFFTVTSNFGQVVPQTFYNDAENVAHWFGYIAFDLTDDCGEVNEESLTITAVDIHDDSSSQTYGPFAFLGRLGVSMNPTLDIRPGEQDWMPVYLESATCFCMGGFVLTVEFDFAVVTVTDVRLGDVLADNAQYFIPANEPHGPGTYRCTFIAIPNSNLCDLAEDQPFLEIKFQVNNGPDYPDSFTTPICFYTEEPYYESNTISDKSGYGIWYPYGCDYGAVQLDTECGNITVLDEQNSGYAYFPGDVNMYNGNWPPQVIGGDVTYLVNFFRGMESSIPCELAGYWASSDANGDCNVIGSDVTRLVTYFRGQNEILSCQDFPPLWQTTEDLPAEAPGGWPNCESDPGFGKLRPAGSVK
ncbi:MAG: hypothetical protein GY839_15520 [candidate division Zixibacteria bacterium]|nr:hypothetical protein [candidate division Zixibacteria bacterium]